MSEAIIFEFPYNLFIKQRLEFVVICQDHLAASIMRIVEREMIRLKEAWQARAEKAADEKKPLPTEPKAYWVRLSIAQIIAKLYMYDSGKLRKPDDEDAESQAWTEYRAKKAISISRGTLRKAIELLIKKGFLLRRSKPGDEYGAALYTLDKENVQVAMKALPKDPFAIFFGGCANFEHGGDVQNLNVPGANFEHPDAQNLNVPGSKNEYPNAQILNIIKDSNKDLLEINKDNEKREITANAALTHAPAQSQEMSPAQELRERVEETIPVVDAAFAAQQATLSHSQPASINAANSVTVGDAGYVNNNGMRGNDSIISHIGDGGPTPEHVEICQEQALSSSSDDPIDQPLFAGKQFAQIRNTGTADANHASEQQGQGIGKAEGGLNATDDAPLGDRRNAVSVHAGTGQTSTTATDRGSVARDSATKSAMGRGKTGDAEQPSLLTMPPAEEAWTTRACLMLFDQWRGKPLITKYQLQQASQCAKALAANYTREQVEAVRTYMVGSDPWWSLRPEKVDICTVSKFIHEKLPEMERAQGKTKRKPANSDATPPTDPTSMVVWTRHKHSGAPIDHWYLYESMTIAEAHEHGYQDIIPPNDRGNIKRLLKGLVEGRRKLTSEQQAEFDKAKCVVA
jgi:hypothetical protein